MVPLLVVIHRCRHGPRSHPERTSGGRHAAPTDNVWADSVAWQKLIRTEKRVDPLAESTLLSVQDALPVPTGIRWGSRSFPSGSLISRVKTPSSNRALIESGVTPSGTVIRLWKDPKVRSWM